jgi:hypothetical protein
VSEYVELTKVASLERGNGSTVLYIHDGRVCRKVEQQAGDWY